MLYKINDTYLNSELMSL